MKGQPIKTHDNGKSGENEKSQQTVSYTILGISIGCYGGTSTKKNTIVLVQFIIWRLIKEHYNLKRVNWKTFQVNLKRIN